MSIDFISRVIDKAPLAKRSERSPVAMKGWLHKQVGLSRGSGHYEGVCLEGAVIMRGGCINRVVCLEGVVIMRGSV